MEDKDASFERRGTRSNGTTGTNEDGRVEESDFG